MACCMLGVIFFWQMVEAWRRVKTFLGLPLKAVTPAGAAGNPGLRLMAFLRKPWARAIAVVLLGAELAIGGNLLYQHRDHLREELASAASLVGITSFNASNVHVCRVAPRRVSLTSNP